MNFKSLLIVPAALALCAPKPAEAYASFRLGFGFPLIFPIGYYSAPVGYTRTVVYDSAPRQAVGEQVTVAPGPGYVWMAGHWSNVSQRWVWIAGHWEMPPSPSAVWTGGHWVQGNGGWVWVDGAWTIGAAATQLPRPPPGAPGQRRPMQTRVHPHRELPDAGGGPYPSTPAPSCARDGGRDRGRRPAARPLSSSMCPQRPIPTMSGSAATGDGAMAGTGTAGAMRRGPYHGAVWVSGGWGHAGATLGLARRPLALSRQLLDLSNI
jgi:hypothetical protein